MARLRRLARVLATALAALVLILLAGPPASGAGEEDPPKEKRCLCADREACWHFLHAPVGAPEDPCACPKCTPSQQHEGKTVPPGWNPDCFATGALDCFLKRQAASWRLICSECVENTACCKRAHPGRCPSCQEGDAKDPMPRDAATTARTRADAERKVFDRARPIVVISRRAYVVTDIQRWKLRTQAGSVRTINGHELAHLTAIRAEMAYRDFRDLFAPSGISRPVGIYVPQRETTARALQAAYFRNPEAHMVYSSYGGASQSAISDGFCLNGFCVSGERIGDDDRALHQAERHLLANVFFTNWIVSNGEERSTPPWAFEGIAHFLGKRPAALADEVYYCEGEDNTMAGSGKRWLPAVTSAAAAGSLRPIDEILATRALGKLSYRDLQQVWAWFHVAMEDCPKQWVELLQCVRREEDVHQAFRKVFGFPAREFQARLVARLTGVKRNLLDGPDPKDAAPTAPAGAAGGAKSDPAATAARIRAAAAPADRATVVSLLDAIGSGSVLVRETALAALLRAKTPEARAAIPAAGLAHAQPIVRAYSARLCRLLKIADAKEPLRKAMDDAHWLVRSEAALAALANRDWDAQARVREMLGDPSPKVRIAACDALRSLRKEVNPICVPLVCANLTHADWQVKVATCQALAVVGDARAVGPLVERLPVEGGRVGDEILRALREITGDDLGNDPENWRKWWEKVGPEAVTTGFPKREPRPGDEKYGPPPPKAYGVELATWRVGFVVDTSRSTVRAFNVDPANAATLLGGATSGTIQQLFRGSVVAHLRRCDSRTRFNVWAFNTAVTRWERSLRPATPAMIESADGFLAGRTADGETDFHAALRAALDVDDGDDYAPGFRETPDTIFFLTDGTPTVGELLEPEMVLRWYGEVNRYARMRTHTVAFGALGVDERLLQALASGNDGTFVQVGETHGR